MKERKGVSDFWGQGNSRHTHRLSGWRVKESGLSACGRLYVSKFIHSTITGLLVMASDDSSPLLLLLFSGTTEF